MLQVNYNERIGYYTERQGGHDYKVDLCKCNALCAMIYFYTDKDEDGKEAEMAQLQMFFADIKHAENCAKNSNILQDYKDFHFYAKQMNTELWKLVKLLANNGVKVTIE